MSIDSTRQTPSSQFVVNGRAADDTGEILRCSECGRTFLSLRALHAHETLTEIPRIASRLCASAPGQCGRNWISGRCEIHTNEARRLVRELQRERYVRAGKKPPSPLRVERRRPAIERLAAKRAS